MFNSSQDKLKDFLLELWAKMMMNADHFSLSQDKLWYAITRVTGKAKDQVLLYCIGNTVNLTDLTAFEELMQNAFEDPDWQGTAQTTIQWLCQWKQDFSTYLAEFNRHVSYTRWNEEAKKSALLAEISDKLCQLLITVNTTGLNMGGLTRTLQMIDNCHRAAQQVTRNNPRPHITTPQPARSESSFFNTSTSPFVATQRATVPTTGEDSMNLFTAQSCPCEPLSVAEKTRWMQNNLCLYCRGKGHKVIACTARPSVQMQLRQIFFDSTQPEVLKPKNE